MSESVQAIPPFIDAPVPEAGRRPARPTAREWRKHAVLFLLTALTATFAGITHASETIPDPVMRPPAGLIDYLLYIPEFYLKLVAGYTQHAFANPSLLVQGAT